MTVSSQTFPVRRANLSHLGTCYQHEIFVSDTVSYNLMITSLSTSFFLSTPRGRHCDTTCVTGACIIQVIATSENIICISGEAHVLHGQAPVTQSHDLSPICVDTPAHSSFRQLFVPIIVVKTHDTRKIGHHFRVSVCVSFFCGFGDAGSLEMP